MSFLNSLSKAFGFAPQDIEEVQPVNQNVTVISVESDNVVPLPKQNEGGDTSVIFAGIVEVLNQELPPYLRSCLDTESQRRYLFEHLDNSIKEFIERLQEKEKRNSTTNTNKEKDRLKALTEELKEKLHGVEEKLQNETERALSAERQKRAMNARIKDLEEKIGTLEAEIEQYDLENKSLLNKLRVASVKSQMSVEEPSPEYVKAKEENETLKKEIENLQAELNRLAKESKKEAEVTKKTPENDPAQMLLW